MPYKTGKLKGELTLLELKKLVKAHNKLQSIQVPSGINRDDMIKLINSNGFDINHKQEKIIPRTRPRRQDVSLVRAKKILEKPKQTAIQKQKADEKKDKILETKKKKERENKKQIIDEQKQIQKKKDAKKPVEKKPPVKKPVVKKPVVKKPSKPKVAYKDLTKDVIDTYGKKKPPVKKPKDIKAPVSKPRKPRTQQTQADKDIEIDMVKKYKGTSAVQKNPDMDEIEVNNVKNGILTAKQYDDIRNIPAQSIYDNLKSGASPIFFPWSSFAKSEIISLTYILKNNQNDCSIPEDTIRFISLNKAKGKSIKNKNTGETSTTESKMVNPNLNIIDMSNGIALSIIRCWKKGKKVVCIPISITQAKKNRTSHHANMLIFNTYRMEAEHFEPHGQQFHGGSSKNKKGEWKWKKITGINFADGIKAVNEKIKLNDEAFFKAMGKFKYLNTSETCPFNHKQMKGFQARDSYKQDSTRDFNGVVITEIGGYCAMWSLFYLDMRLKSLKQPTQKIYGEMAELFTKEYSNKDETFIHLMRGMSKFAWEKQMGMVKKGLLTKEALIGMLGRTEEEGTWAKYSRKYYDAVDKFILDDWKTFTE